MSALDRQPANKNYLSQLSYAFSVKKLPNVNFFLQEVNLPAISIPPTEHPNPFVPIPYSGDHIEYDPLVLSFIVDEDMQNYMELHNWIRGLGFPEDYSEHKELVDAGKQLGTGEGQFSDASLLIGTNLKNPNIEVIFRDAFPFSLSGFSLNTTDEDVTYITCQCQFKYTLFDIQTLQR
jgi:hypothetical protein